MARDTSGVIVDHDEIRKILATVASGALGPDDALARLEGMTFIDLGDAKLDVSRGSRTGQPEVVYGPGKTPDQVAAIVAEMIQADIRPVLVTRATPEQFQAVAEIAPEAVHHARADLIVLDPQPTRSGRLAVVAAGTSDLRVAEEASLVAEAFGLRVERIVDVGVAGIHRLLAYRHALETAGCIVVVAGMEGALPSAVAGLVSTPVIAVPTSVGYGATLGGLAALLAMLSGCVPGVVVVNVDNGVGAAMAALRIFDA